MTDPVGYVTSHTQAVFGGYFPLDATGLVTTSTGPEIEPPQSNMEYCSMKSTVPLELCVACNSIIQTYNMRTENNSFCDTLTNTLKIPIALSLICSHVHVQTKIQTWFSQDEKEHTLIVFCDMIPCSLIGQCFSPKC